MTTRKNLLDRVQIASPCKADWDEMQGSNQIRYCSECHKYVNNLAEMTRTEAESLVASRGNQMCVRLTRDLNGNTHNADSPPIRLLGWRPGPVVRTVLSALISIAPAEAALSQGRHVASRSAHSAAESGRATHRPVPGAATSAIAGIVSDENGAPKAGVVVTLTSEASGEVLSQLTSEEGEFRFDGLPARTYFIEAKAQGYRAVQHHDIKLQLGQARRIDIAMEKLVVMSGVVSVPPQPLRTLYLASDRVVVGQVLKTTDLGKESVNLVKTSLSVSHTIKGDGHKSSVDVYHWRYGMHREFSEGETVIVFLQRREEAGHPTGLDSYGLIYGSESAKHLSDSDIGTYLQRLEELKAILNNPESKATDTVEWLVRCAEDPVTRREGAFELSSSAMREVWDKELADRIAAGETVAPIFRQSRDEESRFSSLLTGEQKQRLMNALLKTDEFGDGDYELVDLVKRWDDPRLLPFLMTYLRRHPEKPPESIRRTMQTVADLLADDKLTALLRHYYENASYEDVVAEQNEAAPDADEAVKQDEEADEVDDADVETSDSEQNAEAAQKLTPEAAKQARAAMLKKFLEAAEAKIKAATTPRQ